GPSRVMAHALVQGALAAAQNKNAMVGATGAATGELVGMMATQLYHKDASQLTEGEKETVSTLATLAAGLAGGLTGDSTASALAGAQTGKTVVENNALSDWGSLIPPQTQQDAYLAFQLMSQGQSQDEIAQALILSHQNPSMGAEYKVTPTAKIEGAAGILMGVFVEGAVNEDVFSLNGGLAPTFGLRGSATVGMDFGPYLPGLIPTNHDSSFDIGIGGGSLGIALGKDGVGFSLGVGPSIGWGGVSKEIKGVDVEGNGKIGNEIYRYEFKKEE
ncbi:polymorphic toxin type 25 domain-containing protein, partial [Aeromonas veronii]